MANKYASGVSIVRLYKIFVATDSSISVFVVLLFVSQRRQAVKMFNRILQTLGEDFRLMHHGTFCRTHTFFLISLSLGETLLLEPFDVKVYDLLPVFLPELLSYPSNHLCLAPIFWLVFLSLSFRLS